MIILELDIGNSRMKWRRLDGGRRADGGAADELAELAGGPAPAMVRLCSVRSAGRTARLLRQVRELWGVEPLVARAEAARDGVVNGYADPRQMGADRWLALLAARRRAGGACVVADAGTALTVDALDGDGRHLGGHILPGLRLMARSLEEHTGIRLDAAAAPDAAAPGRSTEAAVRGGALAAAAALVERTMARLGRESGGPVRLLLTGGDAPRLEREVAAERVEVAPELVLDGLAVACPAEETGVM